MTTIDFRTLPQSVPVMCIPRVFPNIDERRIRRIFDELNMGEIHHVDIVGKKTPQGETFNRVFVHFRRWFNNPNANTARERLINGKEVKIIYDEPWFWKITAYRETAATPQPIVSQHKKATIQFDSDEDRPAAPVAVDEFGREISRRPQHHNNHSRPQHHNNHSRPQHHSDNSRRPRKQDEHPDAALIETLTTEGPIKVEYEAAAMPVKKRNLATKKPAAPLKVLEEGEVEEN